MIVSIMILITVLTEFFNILFTKERVEYADALENAKKSGELLDSTYNSKLLSLTLRILISIAILFFWIYALLFIHALLLPIILNIVTSSISLTIMKRVRKKNEDLQQTYRKRVLLSRIDSVISLSIWFPYFLPLLALVF